MTDIYYSRVIMAPDRGRRPPPRTGSYAVALGICAFIFLVAAIWSGLIVTALLVRWWFTPWVPDGPAARLLRGHPDYKEPLPPPRN